MKTDHDSFTTKARVVARALGKKHGVDYFETFAATPSVSSMNMELAIAVRTHRLTQAFVRAPLDTDVFMKLPMGCGRRTGDMVKLDRAPYGVKQTSCQ